MGTDNVTLTNNSCRGTYFGIEGGWTLVDNETHTNWENGILVNGTGSGIGPTVKNCTVGNSFGKGISVHVPNAIIAECDISGNMADGIELAPAATNTTIQGNSINQNVGRAIIVNSDSNLVVNNQIIDNRASGITDYFGSGNRYYGNTIRGQQLPLLSAIEILATNVLIMPEVRNNTVAFNAGPGLFSTIVNSSGTPYVVNNIFWENNGVGEDLVGLQASDYAYNDIENNANPTAGTGNFRANPSFVDDLLDLHLSSASPCIDQGINSARGWMVDRDQEPRVLDGSFQGSATVDVGADEVAVAAIAIAGSFQQGSALSITIDGPMNGTCAIVVAANAVSSPGLGFSGYDHPVFGTLLLNPADLLSRTPYVSGLPLGPSGTITVNATLPASFAGFHIALQGAVSAPGGSWGQFTPLAGFQILP